MIYAFALVDDQGQTQFGLVTAQTIDEALDYIYDAFDPSSCDVSEDLEFFLNSQYNGLALLTTV